MLVIPLKTTNKYDIAAPLACWLDEEETPTSPPEESAEGGENNSTPQKPPYTSHECQKDLQRLSMARLILSDAFATPTSHEAALYHSDVLPKAYEYHAMLVEYEKRGFYVIPPLKGDYVVTDGGGSRGSGAEGIYWSSAFQTTSSSSSPSEEGDEQTIRYERSATLFNIAALHSHIAKKEHDANPTNKNALKLSMTKYSTAASILEHLQTSVVVVSPKKNQQHRTSLDFSQKVLQMCQKVMLAQGQCCMYETATLGPKLMHVMLAKIAMGAADLFDDALDCKGETLEMLNGSNNNSNGREGVVVGDSSGLDVYKGWIMYIQIKSLLYRARAEHHEAMSAFDKSSWGVEIARLRNAERLCLEALEIYGHLPVSFAGEEEVKTEEGGGSGDEGSEKKAVLVGEEEEGSEDFTEEEDDEEDDMRTEKKDANIGPLIHNEITTLRQTIQQRLTEAQTQNDQVHKQDIPKTLKPSRGQNFMRKKEPLPKELTADPKTILSPPLFEIESVLDSPEAQNAITTFNTKLADMLKNMKHVVDRSNKYARSTLAGVNLPQALTAYNMSISSSPPSSSAPDNPAGGGSGGGGNAGNYNGGLPEELWAQVESIQRTHEVQRLKQNLWQLKDISEMARNMVAKLTLQLDEDIEVGRAFAEIHPTFDGPNIPEVQAPLRQSLEGIKGWLANAQTGDAVLLQMLEKFETDPKYGLLLYGREQLDRLVPPPPTHSLQNQQLRQQRPPIDTSILGTFLVELSNMIKGREALLAGLVLEAKKFNFRARLVEELGHDSSSSTTASTSSDENEADHGAEEAPLSSKFDKILQTALDPFMIIQQEVLDNVDRQPRLLENILAENETFTEALRQLENDSSSTTPAGHKCIRKIEDAVSTVKRVEQQLSEGRKFYDVVMPRLEQLKAQASELSVKLAVKRYDFEDRAEAEKRRMEQEIEDAKVAAMFAAEAGGGQDGNVSRQSTRDIEEDARVAAEIARTFSEEAQCKESDKSPVTPSSPGSVAVGPDSDLDRMGEDKGAADAATALQGNGGESMEREGGDNGHSSQEASRASDEHGSPRRQLNNTGDDVQRGEAGGGSKNEQTLGYRGASFRNPRPAAGGGRPGVQFVSNFEVPPTRVDDEKLATLVAMDFDPEKVFAALQKYDNNVEQALEELLTGG